jgi:hypothetical protein
LRRPPFIGINGGIDEGIDGGLGANGEGPERGFKILGPLGHLFFGGIPNMIILYILFKIDYPKSLLNN